MKTLRGIASLILALCLALGCAATAEVDFDPADYTTEELREIQRLVRDALEPDASFTGEEITLYDEGGITVTLVGWNYVADYCELNLELIVENDSDRNVSVTVSSATLNDWTIYMGGYIETTAGKMSRDELYCYTDEEAGITLAEQLETLEMTLDISDPETYDTIATSEIITLNF